MSDQARRLITENHRTRATHLDLGNCGLRDIPDEIGDLPWLESLSFATFWYEHDGSTWQQRTSQNRGNSNANLTDLTPISRLAGLRKLILRNTGVKDLAPLAVLTSLQTLEISGTRVADLTPLSSIPSLQSLSLSATTVADLGPLATLTSLQTLEISATQVVDLGPLATLTSLQTLEISDTLVTDLTPLASLTSLRSLEASGTRVADLGPLASLTSLQTLYVSDTRVADLVPLASLTSLQSLDVSSTQIADLAPFASLTSLQSLSVSFTRVADLTPLATLTSLQSLSVYDTQVADLAPLASLTTLQSLSIYDTPVADLAPLASLTSLRTLDICGTQVADLAPLASLTSLRTLDICGTQVADLAPLSLLVSLQSLTVSETRVADLAPLASLAAVQSLDVSETRVADLAPLASLAAVQSLNVSSTQVADLSPIRHLIARGVPVKWSVDSWRGPGVYVEGCPFVNPPTEIVRQGNEAILNYFRERETAGVDYLYEAKLLIVGEGGSGKTSLLRRLYQPERPLPNAKETTHGIEIHRYDFPLKNGRSFRLNVWDFGGQEIYHATHQFFLTRRSLYILIDDTRKDQRSVTDLGFKYWLDVIDLFSDHSPVLIFQNEKDGRSKAIDLAGIKGRYDNVKDRYAGNLEHPRAAEALRDAIEYHVTTLGHIGEELPARWIRVRTEIEERAALVPYISQREYFGIYGRHLEFDETKALHLSRYLHDLGVFLHFQDDPLLARTVFLQNAWVTKFVYRILDDENVKGARGRFGKADTDRLWRDSGYADMHPELLALMQRFELCYVLLDTDPKVSLAPQLLSPGRPEALANWGRPDDMVLRYHYDFLPKGVMSRLTVRLHRYVRDPELAWTTGVLFEHGGTQVLMQMLETGADIELRARGTDRRALLSIVAAELDALNDTFRGLRDKVDKSIPCRCKRCRAEIMPEFFSEKALRRRREAGRLHVECPASFEDVDVLDLLEDIRAGMPIRNAKNEAQRSRSRTLRIFLASSSELREDRDAFDLYVRQLNDRPLKDGVYLEVVRWEKSLDSMSETRLQDEYNRAVEVSDVFVSLFFTKTGKFTEEEFDVAHRRFQMTGLPHIYTFFKDADIKTGSLRPDDLNSRWAFEEKLKGLGHFTTRYENIEHLKRLFRDQLDMLLD